MVLPLFALLGMAALFGQSSTASLDGIWEFDIDALGDRNVHRFMLQVSGTNLTTCNRYLAALKATYSMAIRNRKADRNPVKEVRLQKENNKRVRWLTPEEETRLFEVLPKEWHSLVLVALHTGLRRGELLRLKWADLNFQQRLLTVQESKAGEPRQVPMNDVVCEALSEILRRLDNPYVFPGRVKGCI
jgi:integrase